MTEIHWHEKTLSLDVIASADGETGWVSLDQVVAAVEGHLKELPGQAVGLCLPNDVCLPLGQDNLQTAGADRLVRLSALSSLGIVSDPAASAGHILLGDPLPDVAFSRMEGGQLALSDLPQKPTLLFAWASW